MKKLKIFTIILLLTTFATFSQTKYFYGYSSNAHSNYNITHFGNISLGETVTSDGIFLLTLYKEGNVGLRLKNAGGKIEFGRSKCNGCFATNAKIGDAVLRNLGNSHNIILSMPDDENNGSSRVTISDNLNKNNFIVFNNGKVTIGTERYDNDDYKLYVIDGIKTEKIKVEVAAANNWADYVFKKDYKLMSLGDLENYINKHKHLPEIPTTEEVLDNGIELKEMNILLLKKVEELTLHLIEQNKKIERLTKDVELLKQ